MSDAEYGFEITQETSGTCRPNETVYDFLGGGIVADILLWRNKDIPIAILSILSFFWIFVELLLFHFTTLLFIVIYLTFSIMYWKNIPIPKVCVPEAPFIEVSLVLHSGIHRALIVLREIAVARDMSRLKQNNMVFLGWAVVVLSVFLLGSFTFIYIVILMLLTVPISLEKYKRRSGEVAEIFKIEKVLMTDDISCIECSVVSS